MALANDGKSLTIVVVIVCTLYMLMELWLLVDMVNKHVICYKIFESKFPFKTDAETVVFEPAVHIEYMRAEHAGHVGSSQGFWRWGILLLGTNLAHCKAAFSLDYFIR